MLTPCKSCAKSPELCAVCVVCSVLCVVCSVCLSGARVCTINAGIGAIKSVTSNSLDNWRLARRRPAYRMILIELHISPAGAAARGHAKRTRTCCQSFVPAISSYGQQWSASQRFICIRCPVTDVTHHTDQAT